MKASGVQRGEGERGAGPGHPRYTWPMPSRSRRSERRRNENICGKFLHNAIASTAHTVTTQQFVLRVPSTIARTEICLGCWRDRPFLDRTHLVFDEVVPMGREQATRPDSDEDCIGIGEFPCYSHYAEPLARLKQVPILKVLVWPGRDSNHVELWPTGHEATQGGIQRVKLQKFKCCNRWFFSIVSLLIHAAWI